MPVVQIEKSIKVEPDHVYVIAPDQELTIRERRRPHEQADGAARSPASGRLVLPLARRGPGRAGDRHHPLRHRHQRLARPALHQGRRWHRARTGPRIRPPFTGMPQSAIGTGIVDLVLPPDQMPDALLNLARQPYARQPAETLVESTPEDQLHAAADAGARAARGGTSAATRSGRCCAASTVAWACTGSKGCPATSSGCATTRTRSGRSRPI